MQADLFILTGQLFAMKFCRILDNQGEYEK